jgi:hypothetical protein
MPDKIAITVELTAAEAAALLEFMQSLPPFGRGQGV